MLSSKPLLRLRWKKPAVDRVSTRWRWWWTRRWFRRIVIVVVVRSGSEWRHEISRWREMKPSFTEEFTHDMVMIMKQVWVLVKRWWWWNWGFWWVVAFTNKLVFLSRFESVMETFVCLVSSMVLLCWSNEHDYKFITSSTWWNGFIVFSSMVCVCV